jgi:hypothetical protein
MILLKTNATEAAKICHTILTQHGIDHQTIIGVLSKGDRKK